MVEAWAADPERPDKPVFRYSTKAFTLIKRNPFIKTMHVGHRAARDCLEPMAAKLAAHRVQDEDRIGTLRT
ncbi:MAG: hypothetical protein O7D91_13690 [Planctomycetota bacterium]|nr:hypothetical protein [Planctomycetota bacterium]